MSRNYDGYIKLHRQIILSEDLNTIDRRMLWIHLILLASWKDNDKCKRGQIITSLDELKALTGMSINGISCAIKYFKSRNMCSIDSSCRSTCITITNYDKYQINDDDKNGANYGKNLVRTCEDNGKNLVQDSICSNNELNTCNTVTCEANKNVNLNSMVRSQDELGKNLVRTCEYTKNKELISKNKELISSNIKDNNRDVVVVGNMEQNQLQTTDQHLNSIQTQSKPFTEQKREELLNYIVDDQATLTAFYFEVLNVFNIKLTDNPQRTHVDFAVFRDIWNNKNIDVDDLKDKIYDYLYKTTINATSKKQFIKKSFAQYLIEPKHAKSYLFKHGYINAGTKNIEQTWTSK
jgi:hypothetical protein